MRISVPFPMSQGFNALARQWASVGMKRVAQPARANIGNPSLEVAVTVTSSSLESDRIEGSSLIFEGMGSLAVAFEDSAAT